MRVAAVRARSSAGGAIDLKRIKELSGCKPGRRGDEYVLAADRHELVFGVVEDVVVGRVQMLELSGRSWAVSTVLDAETLAWVVWALATRNVVKADELDAAIRRSIVEPWFDYESDRRRTIDGLGRIARGKNRSRRRAAAAELLGRLNSPSR